MIIKATFNDNNYTNILEGFFRNFWNNLFYSEIDGKPVDINTLISNTDNDIKELLNYLDGPLTLKPDIDEYERQKNEVRFNENLEYIEFKKYSDKNTLTYTEKEFVIKYIKNKIMLFLKGSLDCKVIKIFEYLSSKIKVNIVNEVKNIDENGESVYYLVSSNSIIIV